MPRVNRVQRARKSPGTCPSCGRVINKGEPYVWWAFMVGGRGGPKHIRCGEMKCQPKRSVLTQSEFWSKIYELQERNLQADTIDDVETTREELVNELTELRDETQGKFDNMPEGLQQGNSGQRLEERVNALDDVINELEGVDVSCDEGEGSDEEKEETLKSRIQELLDEIQSILDSISCY